MTTRYIEVWQDDDVYCVSLCDEGDEPCLLSTHDDRLDAEIAAWDAAEQRGFIQIIGLNPRGA